MTLRMQLRTNVNAHKVPYNALLSRAGCQRGAVLQHGLKVPEKFNPLVELVIR